MLLHHSAMFYSVRLLLFCTAVAAAVSASPYSNPRPFDAVLSRRQNVVNATSSLTVDLGYEVYQGVDNTSTGLRTFKGYCSSTESKPDSPDVFVHIVSAMLLLRRANCDGRHRSPQP